MEDIYIREGATFEESFTDSDITADTLSLTISSEDGVVLFEKPVSYNAVEDEAIATMSFDVELPIGIYQYMWTITYADGFILKLPDPEGCTGGDCSLPAFVVCDANDVGSS